jgi:hypothetical protein
LRSRAASWPRWPVPGLQCRPWTTSRSSFGCGPLSTCITYYGITAYYAYCGDALLNPQNAHSTLGPAACGGRNVGLARRREGSAKRTNSAAGQLIPAGATRFSRTNASSCESSTRRSCADHDSSSSSRRWTRPMQGRQNKPAVLAGAWAETRRRTSNAFDYRADPALADIFYDRPSPIRDRLPHPANHYYWVASGGNLGRLRAQPIQHRPEDRAGAARKTDLIRSFARRPGSSTAQFDLTPFVQRPA